MMRPLLGCIICSTVYCCKFWRCWLLLRVTWFEPLYCFAGLWMVDLSSRADFLLLRCERHELKFADFCERREESISSALPVPPLSMSC